MLESASVSYGKATYFPIIELLKHYAHVEDTDDVRTIRAKVTGQVLTLDGALQDALRRCGDRKIKRPFPPTASAHPHATLLPSCPLLPAPGVGPTPRASGWPALDAAGWPPLTPQRTDRMGGWGRAACTAGAARGGGLRDKRES